MKRSLCRFEDKFVTHAPDGVAFFYPLPFSDIWRDFGKIGVDGMQAVFMLDYDDIVKECGFVGIDNFTVKDVSYFCV